MMKKSSKIRVVVALVSVATIGNAVALTFGPSTTARRPSARAQSRAAGSDDTAIEIASERQAAIQKAEEAYLRRQLYDPVVAALRAEPPETQEKWKGVLTTADIMLGAFNGGGFSVYREFAGSGAECAYTNGCRYPVPIAYAHASLLKWIDKIQLAFSNLYVSVEHDTRWNAASRLAFFGSMCIVSDVYGKKVPNAPPSLTNACNRALEEATYDFLKERNYTQDEIGMAFHLARYSGQQHGALARAYQRLKAEGVAFDPWMDLMIQAQIAFRKAWDARGSGFANTVTDEGWRIYKEELDKVFPLLEKAYHLRPELSWSCSLALESALGDSYARELWLRRLLACRPDDIYGLSCYLFGLRPRWCGSNRQMARFLLGLVRKQQFDTMVPIFAYEGIVDDVFASEGGVSLEEGSFPSVDKFILACRKDFEPYFKAYHAEGFEAKLSFIERVHLYIALADLAWRLENEEELLHWAGKFEALKMPASETEFGGGYKQYGPYLAALRKLDGTKRHDFLVGLHAIYMDGDPQAIDKMRTIAEEIGEQELAFECALSRKGKVNLVPFMQKSYSATDLRIDFKGRQRDHMIFRVQLRVSEDLGSAQFDFDLLHGARESWREQYGNSVHVEGARGGKAQNRKGTEISVDWPADRETCAFEFEIVGNRTRITQNGVRLAERPISAIPSQCRWFIVHGLFGGDVTVEKLEMEVL